MLKIKERCLYNLMGKPRSTVRNCTRILLNACWHLTGVTGLDCEYGISHLVPCFTLKSFVSVCTFHCKNRLDFDSRNLTPITAVE